MPRYHNSWSIEELCNQFDFPEVKVVEDYILLGDSILRNISNINNTQVMCYPGMTMKKLGLLIAHDKIPELKNKRLIVVHCGTNDASKHRIDLDALLERIQFVIMAIREIVPNAIIAISHIIPRVCDFEKTHEKIMKFNKAVQASAKDWNIKTFPTYDTLQHSGLPIKSFYKPKDKLHLSPSGDLRVRMCLSKFIAKVRDQAGFRRTKRKAPKLILRQSLASRQRYAAMEKRVMRLAPPTRNRVVIPPKSSK